MDRRPYSCPQPFPLQIRAAGGTITVEPMVVLGTTKIMATTDPDGWKVVFVDNQDLLNELKNA